MYILECTQIPIFHFKTLTYYTLNLLSPQNDMILLIYKFSYNN